jgi:hypothetical protein
MKNVVMVRTFLANCLVCGKDIFTETQVEILQVGELKDDKVPFEGRPLGLRVNHDCTQEATR